MFAVKTTASVLAALTIAAGAPLVYAEAKLAQDDTHWVSLGAGIRTSFISAEDAAASGEDRSSDFDVDNFRIYINGQMHQYVKFEFNTDKEGSNSEADIRVLDAVAKFEFSDLFNIWAGRFLPPSDRSNLDGPFYLNTYLFPSVQAYPAIFAGRDDGAAVWGQVGGGKFKYQAGVFEGVDSDSNFISPDITPNPEDNLLFAGRLTLNLLDPEPGYYNSSTYYGAKNVLAIGVAGMLQEDAAVDPFPSGPALGDFTGWSVDALFETNLGAGVISLEGAYYDYDTDDVASASLIQGDGYFALAGYLFPAKIGIGRLQPHVRYQKLTVDGLGDFFASDGSFFESEVEITEVGLNYIIEGHKARVSLIYGNEESSFSGSSSSDDTDFFLVGLQFQI